MQIPDLTERVVGFRQWVVREDNLLWPVATTQGGAWEPGPQKAKCYIKHGVMWMPCFPVVDSDCHCGWYALHSLEAATSYGGIGSGAAVQGIVTGWGRVAVHGEGFRAEYIELMAIIVPPKASKNDREKYAKVAKNYRVPLMDYERAESFAQEFGKKIPKSLMPPTLSYKEMFYEESDPDPLLPNRLTLNDMRQVSFQEAIKHSREGNSEEFPEIPQWIVDVALEIDPDCPEAMAGLYDIYVPNVGDLLLAVIDPPKPNYLKFPEDPIIPARIDAMMTSSFDIHLCTNGAVAYLPHYE